MVKIFSLFIPHHYHSFFPILPIAFYNVTTVAAAVVAAYAQTGSSFDNLTVHNNLTKFTLRYSLYYYLEAAKLFILFLSIFHVFRTSLLTQS